MNKEIKTVSVIGLGALGITYAQQMSKYMKSSDLRIVADTSRIKRYLEEGIYSNNEKCIFNLVDSNTEYEPADLVIFTVKYTGLKDAISKMKYHIGKDTIILSVLNGITSEEMIGLKYGFDHLLYCVAQGMDSQKLGNSLTFTQMGILAFGEKKKDVISNNMKRVANFFDRTKVPYEIDTDMIKRQWGKFMLNVGLNQTVAIYNGTYKTVQEEGLPRETFIKAMKEVMSIAPYEGVELSLDDLSYWIKVLDSLNPVSKPSMAQDVEASRPTEVDLFSKTVIEMGKRHNIPTPVNEMLYEKIKEIESNIK